MVILLKNIQKESRLTLDKKMAKEISFEHEREHLIGCLVKFKKFIRVDTDMICKKIDEQIIDVDRAENIIDLTKIIINLSDETQRIKADRFLKMKENLDKNG